jgi:hypothetical protein
VSLAILSRSSVSILNDHKSQMNYINSLKPNQVFVFGSNATGFHGAGSAGMAFRGEPRNGWREDTAFLRAMKAPVGSPDRIGNWAVFGVVRGFQEGKNGKSYAIQTIVKPGLKRSTPLSQIKSQFVELFNFARQNKDLEFLMTPVGAGLAGYSNEEVGAVWEEAIREHGPVPSNIVVPADLYK